FHSVSAALHDPMPGYHIVSSFKTFDHYGNLQLTFQRRGDTGADYAADIDIDDAQGIEHAFQVIRNSVTDPRILITFNESCCSRSLASIRVTALSSRLPARSVSFGRLPANAQEKPTCLPFPSLMT